MLEKLRSSTTPDTCSVTCAITKVEHQVAKDKRAAGRSNVGMIALCGAVILPQIDDWPSGRACRECARSLKRPRAQEAPTAIPLDVQDLYERERRTPPRRGRAGHRRRCALARLVRRRCGTTTTRGDIPVPRTGNPVATDTNEAE